MFTNEELNELGLTTCGIVTGSEDKRQRCLEPDPTHRGPHWRKTEKISCECTFYCGGHS